jgi:ubiquinone/menaquinone biosynthesis C-methylase UbiE
MGDTMKNLATQYNAIATAFSAVHDEDENSNRDNRAVFYTHLNGIGPGTQLLDVGCGDGLDLAHYSRLGAEVKGIDASSEMLAIARKRLPGVELHCGDFSSMPFADESFDMVVSKYALQIAPDMRRVFEEMHRVLKPGGTLCFLVTHPLRQYLERKDTACDYFAQTIVDSVILNATVVVKEPTHTLNEYFSAWFLARFDVRVCEEHWDAAAEQIGSSKYPGYLIVKAVKR